MVRTGVPQLYTTRVDKNCLRLRLALRRLGAVSSPAHAPSRAAVRAARRGRAQPNGHQTSTGNGRSDHVSRVYNELRTLIISGQLPPGARVAERAVGERLGLSRTPVRSALHRLQQEGFVASSGLGRDQRLFVTPLTQNDGRELLLIVGHLEGLAAREAALLPAEKRRVLARTLREI